MTSAAAELREVRTTDQAIRPNPVRQAPKEAVR
jgi:hypothetical protein